jgi:hypothetical protein
MASSNKRMRGASRYKALQQDITAESAAAVADMAGAQKEEDMSFEVAGERTEGRVEGALYVEKLLCEIACEFPFGKSNNVFHQAPMSSSPPKPLPGSQSRSAQPQEVTPPPFHSCVTPPLPPPCNTPSSQCKYSYGRVSHVHRSATTTV